MKTKSENKDKKIFRHIDVYIHYDNAVVPDCSGDVLGWNEALESHEADREPLAKIFKKNIAEVCKQAIEKHYENVNLNEIYESDYVSIEFDEIYDTEENGPTLQWYWKYIVQDAYAYHENLSQVDRDGKEFEWEDEEKLFQQVPPISDFIHFIQEEAASHVEYFQEGNHDDYFPIEFHLENLRKMLELAEKLYGNA